MSSGLARASTLIAAGTLVSRITGLVRTIVLVTAIGAIGQASDAFGIANQLPSTVLALISTGLLTGVMTSKFRAVERSPSSPVDGAAQQGSPAGGHCGTVRGEFGY